MYQGHIGRQSGVLPVSAAQAEAATNAALDQALIDHYEVKGDWDLSQGVPLTANSGDRYRVSNGGTLEQTELTTGDHFYWNGYAWICEHTASTATGSDHYQGGWDPANGAPSATAEFGQYWQATSAGDFSNETYSVGDYAYFTQDGWQRRDNVDDAGLHYVGYWDARTGQYPVNPPTHGAYLVQHAGEVSQGARVYVYQVGDTLTWTGSEWVHSIASNEMLNIVGQQTQNHPPSYYRARWPSRKVYHFVDVRALGLKIPNGFLYAGYWSRLETETNTVGVSGGPARQFITLSDGTRYFRSQLYNKGISTHLAIEDSWGAWQLFSHHTNNELGMLLSSRNGGLVTNSRGALYNSKSFLATTNFSVAVLTNELSPNGAMVFKGDNVSRWEVRTDEFIPVDPQKTYRLSLDFRYGRDDMARFYGGVFCFSIDKEVIRPEHGAHRAYGVLSQDVSIGDASIFITPANGSSLEDFYQGGSPLERRIALFGYQSSSGVEYEPFTYTRWIEGDTSNGAYKENGINVATGEVTLRDGGWQFANPKRADGVWPAGTPIGNCHFSNLAQVCLGAHHPQNTEWQHVEGEIGGLPTTEESEHVFLHGTHFIKPNFQFNWVGPAGDVFFANVDCREQLNTPFSQHEVSLAPQATQTLSHSMDHPFRRQINVSQILAGGNSYLAERVLENPNSSRWGHLTDGNGSDQHLWFNDQTPSVAGQVITWDNSDKACAEIHLLDANDGVYADRTPESLLIEHSTDGGVTWQAVHACAYAFAPSRLHVIQLSTPVVNGQIRIRPDTGANPQHWVVADMAVFEASEETRQRVLNAPDISVEYMDAEHSRITNNTSLPLNVVATVNY